MTEPVAADSAEGLRKAWREFASDGRYRMIRPEEFGFSEAAKMDLNRRLENYRYYTERPFVHHIFHPQGSSSDLAVIVVDTTRDDANRFGLVIINSPEGEKGAYEVNWLFQERDLSKAFINGSRAGMSVTTYNDDGSRQTCFIKWDQRLRQYSCDDRDKSPDSN